MYEYGLIEAPDEADFTAKLGSLKSKCQSCCTGIFEWFLKKRKRKITSSVICSAREGTDVCGLFYQNYVESQHFVENFRQSFKKKSVRDAVLGSKTVNERKENEEMRAIYRPGSYRFVSFFILSFMLRLKSKTTVFMF